MSESGAASAAPLALGAARLTVADVRRVADREAAVTLDPAAVARVRRGHAALLAAAAAGEPIYGLNRGVGYYRDRAVDPTRLREFNRDLLRAHAGGVGAVASPRQVRAVILARLNTLLAGHSGCSPALVDAYRALLAHDLMPVLPLRGSVGAADITCLAHLGLALMGEGEVWVDGRRTAAAAALAAAGVPPLEIGPKDALAIVSSNALSAGLGALVLARAAGLIRLAERTSCLSLEGFHGHLSPLEAEVVAARGSPELAASARACRDHLAGSYLADGGPPGKLQDPLSFRTAAHVHGAARAAEGYARGRLEGHLNASEDNPCVLADPDRVRPSGNFNALDWTLAFEQLGLAMAHLSKLSCRRTMRLTEPGFTGLPAYLAADAALGFGFSELQKTFASLQAEVRHLANPATLDDLSLAGDMEDHAVNAPLVVRKADEMLDAVGYVLAIEALHGASAVGLRPGARLGRGTRALRDAVAALADPAVTDRNRTPEIERLAAAIRAGRLPGLGAEAAAP